MVSSPRALGTGRHILLGRDLSLSQLGNCWRNSVAGTEAVGCRALLGHRRIGQVAETWCLRCSSNPRPRSRSLGPILIEWPSDSCFLKLWQKRPDPLSGVFPPATLSLSALGLAE